MSWIDFTVRNNKILDDHEEVVCEFSNGPVSNNCDIFSSTANKSYWMSARSAPLILWKACKFLLCWCFSFS